VPKSALIRLWRPTVLALGLAFTVTWVCLLGYGAVALTEFAFDYYAPTAHASWKLGAETTAPDAAPDRYSSPSTGSGPPGGAPGRPKREHLSF
jgi:hypothetical protein